MDFIPLGRNIVIEFLGQDDEAPSPILLPSDYRPADTPYEVVRVASDECGNKCEMEWNEGEIAVVEAHMIRQFAHNDIVYHLIAENHVIGWFSTPPKNADE